MHKPTVIITVGLCMFQQWGSATVDKVIYNQGHYGYYISYNIGMPSQQSVNFVQYANQGDDGSFVQVRTQKQYTTGFNIINRYTSMEGYKYWYFSIGVLS